MTSLKTHEGLERYLEREPEEWRYEDLPLNKRIALEIIHRCKAIEHLREGLIVKDPLVEFMTNFEPQRRDFYASRLIPPEEFRHITERYGEAAIFKSLPESSARYQELLQQKRTLAEYLFSLPIEKRIHPDEMDSAMRGLAMKLYGRTENAVIDLCGHSFSISNPDYIVEAYRIFVDEGKQAANQYLKRWKYRPQIVSRLLRNFSKHLDTFTGKSLGITSSNFEQQAEAIMDQEGVRYQRHVPYSTLSDTETGKPVTERKFRMDFFVGNTIIEVTDRGDDFIHDRQYQITLKHKAMLAARAGKVFMVLTPDQDIYEALQIVLASSTTPEGIYDFGAPQPEDSTFGEPVLTCIREPADRRRVYFCLKSGASNARFMAGHLR